MFIPRTAETSPLAAVQRVNIEDKNFIPTLEVRFDGTLKWFRVDNIDTTGVKYIPISGEGGEGANGLREEPVHR